MLSADFEWLRAGGVVVATVGAVWLVGPRLERAAAVQAADFVDLHGIVPSAVILVAIAMRAPSVQAAWMGLIRYWASGLRFWSSTIRACAVASAA